MLRLLKLATDCNCEEALGVYVAGLIVGNKSINIEKIEMRFNPNHAALPDVVCVQHNLNQYDALVLQ